LRGRLSAAPALLTGLAALAALVVLALLVGLLSLTSTGDGDTAGAAAASASSAGRAAPVCTPAHLNVSAALAGSRVTVSPAPETRDASAATQISLLGVPASELSDVTVTGSRSGRHGGRLLAYSQGNGGSFVPSHPFSQGELVRVSAKLQAGAQAIPFAWSFTVAVRDTGGEAGGTPHPAPHPAYYQSFRSRPDLQPPTVTVATHLPGSSPGDIFLAPYSGPGQYGPMILDETGTVVWFKPLSPQGTRAADFRVQQYEGKPVLTWWQDPLIAAGRRNAGEVIMNSSYQQIAIVRAGNGYQPDLHEFQITPEGTALITVYNGIDCDLSAVGGPRDAAVADTLMQEIDLKTGLVTFEWHSLDHVALSASYASGVHASQTTPFDYFHINSTDVEPDGDLLIDARNTWAAYDVDPRTGRIRWQLGGRHSSFQMGAGARPAWQHDARRQPDGTITFFDNGATPVTHPQSRAIELALDPQQMTARLVRHDEHPGKPLVAGSQGNLQALEDGDWMVGWGEQPYVSEFSPAGQLLLDAHLPAAYESYRAYRLPWSGEPTGPPAVVYQRASGARGGGVVYASWNGATQLASWRVLAGPSPAMLTPLSSQARTGFETAIALPGAAAPGYVAVQALDAAGNVLSVSPAVRMSAAP
jgi:Arylsulfotransferase (ASST)